MSGSSRYKGSQFASMEAIVRSSGSGQATVNASDSLRVKISGSSAVHYLGHPAILSTVTGSGSVDHAPVTQRT
jgi:hypothetical protein